MPPGRDSFRRNRVAPLTPHFTTQVHLGPSRPSRQSLPRPGPSWANPAGQFSPCASNSASPFLTHLQLITYNLAFLNQVGLCLAFTLPGWLRTGQSFLQISQNSKPPEKRKHTWASLGSPAPYSARLVRPLLRIHTSNKLSRAFSCSGRICNREICPRRKAISRRFSNFFPADNKALCSHLFRARRAAIRWLPPFHNWRRI